MPEELTQSEREVDEFDKMAQEIVGKWGYEEPYWWEPIASALRTQHQQHQKALIEERINALEWAYESQSCNLDAPEAIIQELTRLKKSLTE